MSVRRAPPGLIFKIALFYALVSLPTLVLVESTVLIFEFQRFVAAIDDGALRRASERAADELGQRWPRDGTPDPQVLDTIAESWVLRMERPNQAMSLAKSYVLFELAADPLTTAILTPDGRVLAQAPEHIDWQPQLPRLGKSGFANVVRADETVALPGADSPYTVRRVLAPVHDTQGRIRALVYVELRLPQPWRRYLLDWSVEWPIIVAYLAVFGIASVFFLTTLVTRRLRRVAAAAEAWSRGDFTGRIGDRSHDEIGRLSTTLDRMAVELKDLLHSRTQLATLAERQRLARDLHDTVKQKAFALNLQLATARRLLSGTDPDQHLEQAQRLTRKIQQNLAQILDELRPADADLPFAERLRARADEWAGANSIDLQFDAAAGPDPEPAIQDTLLRITDEALANVLRHSGAERVEISWARGRGSARLSIADNGRWQDNEPDSGRGLRNMRERAASLPGGRFELAVGKPHNTRITVTFSVDT